MIEFALPRSGVKCLKSLFSSVATRFNVRLSRPVFRSKDSVPIQDMHQ